MIDNNFQADVTNKIIDILVSNGFEYDEKHGEMVRKATGCWFTMNELYKYTSVLDFQLDWPYA